MTSPISAHLGFLPSLTSLMQAPLSQDPLQESGVQTIDEIQLNNEITELEAQRDALDKRIAALKKQSTAFRSQSQMPVKEAGKEPNEHDIEEKPKIGLKRGKGTGDEEAPPRGSSS